MSTDINVNNGESIIKLTHQREPDGKVTITTILLDSGETFAMSIDAQEPAERSNYVNSLCADRPGIGGNERKWIRGELQKIARATAIDLRFNTCGPVNGSASCSARLWSGSKVIETASLNLLDPNRRRKAIKHLAPYVAGRNASKKKLEAAERDLTRLFMAELQRVLSAPPQPPRTGFSRESVPYSFDDQGINWLTKTREGAEVVKPLTNFTAKIIAEVTRDDGSGDPELEFELEAYAAGHKQRFIVKASKFAEMSWTLEKLGTRGLVYAGQGAKDHARAAILWLSENPPRKHVHTHTGWLKTGDAWVYLHAAGAIAGDAEAKVDVALDGALASYEFPEPPTDAVGLKAAVRASLGLLELAPADVVYPAYCAIWRSILGRCDFAVHLVGRSGVFKSELAALLQQHFGAQLNARNLPGAWRSTDNALGELLFLAKDVLCTIDDFKPHGTQQDVQKWHAKADNIFRGQGNGAGKQRMRAEGGLRVTKPPRGMILSTGEQIPRGESCRARMMIVQVSPGDIDGNRLTGCQRTASEGAYAAAAAAFIRWLATDARIEKVRQDMRQVIASLRDRAQSSELHKRTPEIIANLYVGLLYWLEFATAKGAITSHEQKRIQDDAWKALGQTAEQQLDHQAASEPATRYLELLMSAIASGKAHLAGIDGQCPGPDDAAACGWRLPYGNNWIAQGARIGWIQEENIYLEPDAAYQAAQDAAGSAGNAPVDSERELRKRLEEKGLLRVGNSDQRFNRKATRRMLEGAQRWVLWLAPGALPLRARAARATDNLADEPPSFLGHK